MYKNRAWYIVESFSVSGFIMAYVWIFKDSNSRWLKYAWVPVLVFIFISHFLHKESLETIGFKVWDLKWPPKLLYWGTLFICVSAVFYKLEDQQVKNLNYLYIFQYFAFYLRWGAFQQYLLGYLANRNCYAFDGATQPVAIISALMFSLVHLPNVALTGICLVTGYVSVLLFFKYRNIIAISILHAMLGVTIDTLGYSMTIGHGYLH